MQLGRKDPRAKKVTRDLPVPRVLEGILAIQDLRDLLQVVTGKFYTTIMVAQPVQTFFMIKVQATSALARLRLIPNLR